MFASCACPLPTEIGDIPALECGENLGQIQKIVFQRRQATGSPTFATLILPATLANWTTLKTASDATKVQTTPFFENFIIPHVEAITEGGNDNTTLDGTPLVVGASTVSVTGNFRSIPAAMLAALKAFNCENDLTIFMINEFGKIIGESTTLVSTDFRGIEITEFFIGDGGNEGKNTQDKTMFRFNLRYGWRDKLKFVTPSNFNARFDL
jgi:hypothetical protein